MSVGIKGGTIALFTGREIGYDEGWAAGYSAGYSSGYNSGWNSGYNSGQTAGWNAGYSAGYSAGFAAGQAASPPPSNSDIVRRAFDATAIAADSNTSDPQTFNRTVNISSVPDYSSLVLNSNMSVSIREIRANAGGALVSAATISNTSYDSSTGVVSYRVNVTSAYRPSVIYTRVYVHSVS